MRDHQRGALHALNHGGHGIGFARTRNAEQNLTGHAAVYACGERLDRLRLIALRAERRFELKAAFLHDESLPFF